MRIVAVLRRSAPLGPALALAACTLNVQSVDRTVVTRTTEEITLLRSDLDAAELGHASIVVGPTDTTPTVGLVVRGLLAFDRPIDEILARIHADFDTSDPSATGLRFSLEGTREDAIAVEGIELALRAGTALDLTTTRGSVEVRGLEADARIVASSGSIDVTDAHGVELRATSGSIRVEAEGGTLETDSGSIELDTTGAVVAHASSGSIAGRFGGGGELRCTSGSITLELAGPLDRDLTLRASSGSITLIVPDDLAAHVEARADSGSVDIDVGDARASAHAYSGELNGGGAFTIRADTSSGSIHIVARGR